MVEETKHHKIDNDNWDELQDVWQDTPPVDMEKLARNARFVWWRMRANFALEVGFSLFGMFIFGTLIDFSSKSATLFGLVGEIFCIAGIWAAIHIRRGVWEEADGDTLRLVRLQIKRANSEILYVRVNCWLAYASLVLLVLALWFLYDRIDTIEPWRLVRGSWAFVVVLAVIVIFPLATRPFVRRKKALVENLQLVESELQQEESAA